MNTVLRICASIISVIALCCPLWAAGGAEPIEKQVQQIPGATGVQGGLVVHLGCADGSLTGALRAGDGWVVHGLTRDVRNLSVARDNLRAKGLYGPVSVDLLEGDILPYIDNSVNLIVVSDEAAGIPEREILRVLVPRGVAYWPSSGRKVIKPWPGNIDEWTHYLHDPSNNAVAHDTAIAPLRHLQWDGAPRYSRHHEYTTSVAAVVSARGRLFSIMDFGSRASVQMPAKWRLTARDAFNGIVLWERPLASWFNHLWPLKDGPAQPPRRLVAVGDSVYVTLGIDAPVSRLEAATGRTQQTYAGTEFTQEILCSDGVLFLLKGDTSMNPKGYYPKLPVCWDEKDRTMKESEGFLLAPTPLHLIALDAATGATLWETRQPVEPLTLAADGENVYFHNWNQVVCLDRKTGQEKWHSEPVVPRPNMGYVYGPTLVAYGDVVLFADGRLQRKIWALSKVDGHLLWQGPHYPGGHAGSAEDLLVADGLVWCGKIAGGGDSGVFTGRDPLTGEVRREFTPDVKTYWFHHRCYRIKATDNYLLSSRTGIEFVDIRQQHWEPLDWVRGACTYGILPCNGLIYAPPHPCACYSESKLSGFCAVAPASERALGDVAPAGDRLQQGPAYGQKLQASDAPADQWPAYRHDAARSGASPVQVPGSLAAKWQVDLAGELTAPVIADGRVYVASRGADLLYALSSKTGRKLWTFTADLDSPPTIYRGLVLFGSADGWVYCLRGSDGALVWRFRAALRDERLMSYGRLESVWPVHGSLLVQDGAVYCVAGRSTFLDGGLRFYRLDAGTGRVLAETVLNDQASPQKDVKVLNMPVAEPDILSSDGEMIYMRSQALDREGRRIQTVDPMTEPIERATLQLGRGVHLFSPTGFLDNDAWNRTYWVYGRTFSSGCDWWYRAGRYAPAGRMLVFTDDRVYGFAREPGLFVWSHVLENRLFCAATQASQAAIDRVRQWSKKAGRDAMFNRDFTRHALTVDCLAPQQYWSVDHPPLHVRAMALAGGTLLVAGPPDVLDEDQAFQEPFDPAVAARIRAQDDAYDGKHGALLMGVTAAEGRTLFRLNLSGLPVWDGLAVTNDGVFLCTLDGRLSCFRGQ